MATGSERRAAHPDLGAPSILPVLARSVRIDKAVRALVALDGADPAAPRKLTTLEPTAGSGKFLGLILVALREAELVGAVRGAHGGYWLARPLEEISLLDVFEALAPPGPEARPGADHEPWWDDVELHLRSYLAARSVADASGWAQA